MIIRYIVVGLVKDKIQTLSEVFDTRKEAEQMQIALQAQGFLDTMISECLKAGEVR